MWLEGLRDPENPRPALDAWIDSILRLPAAASDDQLVHGSPPSMLPADATPHSNRDYAWAYEPPATMDVDESTVPFVRRSARCPGHLPPWVSGEPASAPGH